MNPRLRADGTQTRMFPGVQSGDARSVEPDRELRESPEAPAVLHMEGRNCDGHVDLIGLRISALIRR